MTANLQQALEQISRVKKQIVDQRSFRGYSGVARASGGLLAVVTAWVLSRPWYPQGAHAQLWGWGVLCGVAVLCNYVALVSWYLTQPSEKRAVVKLHPTIDVFPPLVVGALLSWVLISHQLFDFLFGTWMCLFGLANVASRHSLPNEIWHLGCFYIFSGMVSFALLPEVGFLNPWPMGLVFCVGEIVGGIIFYGNRRKQI